MGVNKVEYYGKILIDLTNDTVTPETLAEGVIAHDKSGKEIIGIMRADTEDLEAVLDEQAQLISTLQETLNGKSVGGGSSVDTRFAESVMGTLSVIDDSTITSIRQYGLGCLPGLVSVRLPNLEDTTLNCFRGSDSLISADLPNVKSVATYAFYGCTSLTHVNVPKATSIVAGAFTNCSSMTRIKLENVTGIGNNVFNGCKSLDTIILCTTVKVASLANTSVFTNTPIANGTGYIYVPASLLSNYQSATNWSNYAGQFRAIEDYPDICGGGES